MSREKVLGDVRAALGTTSGDERRRSVAARLSGKSAHMIPERAKLPGEELVSAFKQQLEAQGASVIAVDDSDAVPAAVAAYLRAQGVPLHVRMGADRLLAGMPWSGAPGLECDLGAAAAEDTATVSRALAGAAETGTLVLASGADNPGTLAFLPDSHIVVIRADAIVGSYEDAFAATRSELGAAFPPRSLNLISGPSRTADIGGKIVRGAHGPRRLAVIVVGGIVSADGGNANSRDSSAGSV